MTSFDSSPHQLNVWRALLALAVVFVMLATTGWTAVRQHKAVTSPVQAALSAWEHGRVDGHALPAPDSSPARLSHFFASLTAPQRERLAERYPLAVGNMNGAPLSLRYRANHVALEHAREVAHKRMFDKRLSDVGHADAKKRMQRFAHLAAGGREILAFDPMGGGRVAEVFGDIRTADRISIVVPGVGTNLLTFERTSRPYSAPVGMARALYAAERAESPGTRTAVIAWADYTAPDGLGVDAATAMRADEGAVRLNALLHGGLPGRAPVELFCHSYGTVLCGVAAHRLPARVTDIAVAGSPGMRTRNAAGLGTHARVWATRDKDDWIQDVPYLEVGGLGHGADPVSSAFGSRVFAAGDAKGHAGYFTPGTESLANFADIGTGSYRSVRCADSHPDCRNGFSGESPSRRA
ncbi:alpha/beta hydrolase [Streptomyces beihaiensis]|uniref:Alpha/beta hydrolase family protein n=1 Tax=Streptomyces beihaiensis TaxID=2984495 RepID=A0ABT3TSI5_9ACTN|nr:alpha/beta hydrolase [Streptomyces beihaiensis]MCX3060009.1 alpha/beta hydrolase family protein [Streptomyces beihaiensis]